MKPVPSKVSSSYDTFDHNGYLNESDALLQ
jgi:hypothetical protein